MNEQDAQVQKKLYSKGLYQQNMIYTNLSIKQVSTPPKIPKIS